MNKIGTLCKQSEKMLNIKDVLQHEWIQKAKNQNPTKRGRKFTIT